MKLLIAGSRSILSFDLSKYIPDDTDLIITGGAQGIDSVAEKYADTHNISKLVVRPKYKVYGKAAPLMRNKDMIDLCDSVLVIWDGHSRGTKFTIDYSNKIKRPIRVINISEIEI